MIRFTVILYSRRQMTEFQWEEKWIRGGETEVLLCLLNERLINKEDVWPPGAGGRPDDWTGQSGHREILSRPSSKAPVYSGFLFGFGFFHFCSQRVCLMMKMGRLRKL